MAIAIDLSQITVVTATRLEERSARAELGKRVRVVRTGVALRALRDPLTAIAISCGLAGALRGDLPTGTIVIPRSVSLEDGVRRDCDPDLVEALLAAARSLGHEPVDAPLLTTKRLIHGDARDTWARQGYAAVDMETAAIPAQRLACVRVILDTPHSEISDAWEHPMAVLFRPDAWCDLPFLMREAPRCSRLPARVISGAFRT